MDSPREITLHSSLTRPPLLGGAERELTLVNITLILALIFGVGIHWFSISVALFLATIGQYTLTRLAKYDPQMRGLYIRHLHYRDYYPAQASVHSAPQLVKQTLKV